MYLHLERVVGKTKLRFLFINSSLHNKRLFKTRPELPRIAKIFAVRLKYSWNLFISIFKNQQGSAQQNKATARLRINYVIVSREK